MHYGYRKIIELSAAEKGVPAEELIKTSFEHTLTINAGDTAYAPGTTKKFFGGPGEIIYGFRPDGGTDVIDVVGTYITHTKSE